MAFAYTDSYISTETLFTKQSEAIKKIASESSAIFVGRCSDFVLRDDYPQMLSLFVTDDPSVRVKTIMERLGIASEEEAKSVMEKAERIGFSVFVVSFVETVFDAVVEPGCA